MAPQADQELLDKVKAITAGPDKELFLRIVDTFYERMEEYDTEPLTPEEMAMIRESQAEIRRGETGDWEDFKRKRNL